ncbi:unnamed protein product [Rotaria socialis]|uniref:isocitrate dehydrogenase (NAD(+)) n=3 Tax=Rotaria socialis TaxID=392032 RepID=A0A817XIA0_9BILA|nr:unnamed protein product [Rotaria socialis]
MEGSLIQLNDLPDEILLIILKKLDNIEVLYSFIGFNKQLDQLVHGSIFTNCLTMTRRSNDSYYPLNGPVFQRFCSQILPKIHHKVKWLNLESSTMKDILLCTNYPNLYGLGLYNINKEYAFRIFTDETPLIHIFQSKISSLVVDIPQKSITDTGNSITDIFTAILTVCSKLEYFRFGPAYCCQLRFQNPPTISSSTLLEMHVRVECFVDCLYLLDGRFDQLQRLSVSIDRIASPQIIIANKKQIPNLKLFSLRCRWATDKYSELIVPLLHRMFNLVELDLRLFMFGEKRFFDGYDLKYNIISHLLRLNKFVFNISSHLRLNDQIYLSSNEDCQLSFKDIQNNKVISCVDYFSDRKRGQCHIYSYPYQGKRYQSITNNFSYGLFESVREVSLYDERPFEHEFFVKIAKSFPFMEKLTVYNKKAQKNKLHQPSKDDNRHLSIIQYPYLTTLDLNDVHDDYVEQFLLDTKTCLSRTLEVEIDYEPVERVTHNFTRDATRINCAKLLYFCVPSEISIQQQLKDYFPHTKIYYLCVRAPVDFEDIPLSSNVANDEMFERDVMAVQRNGIALKGWKLIDGCREIAAKYPDIKFDIMIINNTCMQLVNRPTQFDVMVTTNLYGNMVSNVCAGFVAGSKYGEHYAIFQ